MEPAGLERLRRMLKNGDHSPMWDHFAQRVIDAGDGWSLVQGTPDAKFNNHMGRTHGGFVATLIDTTLGVAVVTKLPENTGYGTVQLNVHFVRKIDISVGPLLARGTVVHAGRTMLTAEASVKDKDGKLYAHGTGTFLVYPKQ